MYPSLSCSRQQKSVKGADVRDDENQIMDDDVVLAMSNLKNANIPVSDDDDVVIDNCIVKVTPSMNFNDYVTEHIKYPENLIDQLRLEVYQKEDGLIVSGKCLYQKEDRLIVSGRLICCSRLCEHMYSTVRSCNGTKPCLQC